MQQTGIKDPQQLMQYISSGQNPQLGAMMQQGGIDPNQLVNKLNQMSVPWNQQSGQGNSGYSQPGMRNVPGAYANPNPATMGGMDIGNVNYGAIAAYQNAPPGMQQYLASQGLAPNIMTARVSGGTANSGTQSFQAGQNLNMLMQQAQQEGRMLTQNPGAPGSQASWTLGAPGSATWKGNVPTPTAPGAALSGGTGMGLSGIGGMPSMPDVSGLGDIAGQTAAVHAQGALSNLNQQAAASGDSDQLAYKQARLGRELAAGRSSTALDSIMKQAQIAQMFANAATQGVGINNFMQTARAPTAA